jgi:hypothetical protein
MNLAAIALALSPVLAVLILLVWRRMAANATAGQTAADAYYAIQTMIRRNPCPTSSTPICYT